MLSGTKKRLSKPAFSISKKGPRPLHPKGRKRKIAKYSPGAQPERLSRSLENLSQQLPFDLGRTKAFIEQRGPIDVRCLTRLQGLEEGAPQIQQQLSRAMTPIEMENLVRLIIDGVEMKHLSVDEIQLSHSPDKGKRAIFLETAKTLPEDNDPQDPKHHWVLLRMGGAKIEKPIAASFEKRMRDPLHFDLQPAIYVRSANHVYTRFTRNQPDEPYEIGISAPGTLIGYLHKRSGTTYPVFIKLVYEDKFENEAGSYFTLDQIGGPRFYGWTTFKGFKTLALSFVAGHYLGIAVRHIESAQSGLENEPGFWDMVDAADQILTYLEPFRLGKLEDLQCLVNPKGIVLIDPYDVVDSKAKDSKIDPVHPFWPKRSFPHLEKL